MLGCIIKQVRNYMDRTCFILVNACVLWWHKPESQTVCSSTMETVSCTQLNLPNHFEFLRGQSLLSSGDSLFMHRLLARQVETKTYLIPRLDE
jgi:hypothetical protein